MPRPRKPGSAEPKTRSRHGCTQCKQKKIKCGEQKPTCSNCEKMKQACDYSIKLNWDGRAKRKGATLNHMTINNVGEQLQVNGGGPQKDVTHIGGQTSVQTITTSEKQMTPRQLDGSPTYFGNSTGSSYHAGPDMFFATNQPSHFGDGQAYSSPSEPAFEDSVITSGLPPAFGHGRHAGQMPPPNQISPRNLNGGPAFFDRGFKRTKLSPSNNLTNQYHSVPEGFMASRVPMSTSIKIQPPPRSVSAPEQHTSPNSARVPPSPVASSVESDESSHSKRRVSISQPDRRMSIESLISGSYTSSVDGALTGTMSLPSQSTTPKSYHGVDPGYPDFDIYYNHDVTALNDASFTTNASPKRPDTYPGVDCQFSKVPHKAFYKSPIKVRIPDEFEPLPDLLKEPMNLLYFHHFISHTARILVPHDCAGNPFRKILPRMALKDQSLNLLRLLLAYSASHRAKLMDYHEPIHRISSYVDGMFSSLTSAIGNPHMQISNITFATAIMLGSLEIISPNAFKATTPIPWQIHLAMARNIIERRGIRAQTVDRNDDESYFLTRWFAYLDVLGSLSGGRKDLPLFGGDFWAEDPMDPEKGNRIDCFFGFTDRCICILAEIASLAKASDEELTIHRALHDIDDSDDPFTPSKKIQDKADTIRADLKRSMLQPYHGCHHTRRRASTPNPTDDPSASSTTHALEITTTNDSYHWAGQIFLSRRVLRLPPKNDSIQNCVQIILAGLGRIRQAGTAEACMLFPMFIAACEAVEEDDRDRLLERLVSVQDAGLSQARMAVDVVQAVWKRRDEGKGGVGGDEEVGWEDVVKERVDEEWKGFIVC